ncbi:TetR/AcrR family transcriptional regulator [Streptomyces platensis]|uniref:TetR/AcrR family transcriptional regulator n=1 Tax=Streptomyces platensis TaxID=58346 RepID=UPI0038643AC0|nr:TetR/AcrR family transcriptional regulator [Streptomyces platensis]
MTTTEHSGSGDVSRSLELLWGLGDRPSRGPKPGLTLDRIVTTAVAVADTDGLGALSMRRVATDLGVGTMSLYRYVPGKAELLDLMLDKVAEFDADAHPDPAAGWRPAMEALAHASRRQYHRHPWLLQVDQARPLLGPNALESLEYSVRALAGTGLADREKIHVLVSFGGFLAGISRTELHSTLAEKRTGISDADFWQSQEAVLSKAMLSGRYPALAALDENTFAGDDSPVFELGLSALLDGFAALIAARTARTDAP